MRKVEPVMSLLSGILILLFACQPSLAAEPPEQPRTETFARKRTH